MLTTAQLQTRIDALSFDLPPILDPWHTSAGAAYTMTYQFAAAQPADQGTQFTGWTALTQAEKDAVRVAFNKFEAVINVRFVEVTGNADPDLNIGRVDLPTGTAGLGGFQYGYSTSNGQVVSRSWDGFAVFDGTMTGADGMNLLLHEIGHSLSLKHPGNYGGSPAPYLPAGEDNNKFSVMSYNLNPVNGRDSDNLMVYDIAALQQRWGANLTYRGGDDVYATPDGGRIQAIWDARGTDTIDGSAQAGAVTIDLRPGYFSSVGATDNFIVAYGVTIEHAKGGSGNDRLTGNDVANALTGNNGNDTLTGGPGNDTLTGGAGGDTYVNPTSGDTIIEAAGGAGGTDTIETNEPLSLAAYATIERLTLTGAANIAGTGNALDNLINGNTGHNLLSGGAGLDTLNGGNGNDTLNGGGPEADLLRGGAHNDTYLNPAGDTIVELADQGTDTVLSDASFSLELFANVERLFLQGTANISGTGGAGGDHINGNTGNNLLKGLAGADSLNGGDGNDTLDGGAGADTLRGGTGNDHYMDPTGDTIVEDANAGTDTVQTSATFSLAALPNIERLFLIGASAINGTGNGLDNLISGNGFANLLQGADGNDTLNGGDGNDTLNGGAGNDTLNGGGNVDRFIIGAAAGADTVNAFTVDVDKFDLGGRTFTLATEGNGGTTLTHSGGTVFVAGITGLSLLRWNAQTVREPFHPEAALFDTPLSHSDFLYA